MKNKILLILGIAVLCIAAISPKKTIVCQEIHYKDIKITVDSLTNQGYEFVQIASFSSTNAILVMKK